MVTVKISEDWRQIDEPRSAITFVNFTARRNGLASLRNRRYSSGVAILRRNDMAHKALIAALGMILAASPLSASTPDEMPTNPAPAGGPDTRYCMRIELTGNIVEPVRCWTREQWAEQGIDVDKVWATEGIAVKG
jgi:hypothetical protein